MPEAQIRQGNAVKGRLQKLIAASGLCSRRDAEDLLREGRVAVNGRRASLGDSADNEKDVILVDGRPLVPEKKVYIALNKPAGYECSLESVSGKPLVTELVDVPERVYPVGRLDADSRGLILLTNDGDFANRLMHPSSSVDKEYLVTVNGRVSDEQVSNLAEGIILDGKTTAPCSVTVVKRGRSLTILRFVLHEGRKRQIRRMLEFTGHSVGDLVRERVGPLRLAGLRSGSWRFLTASETESLRASAVMKPRTNAFPNG